MSTSPAGTTKKRIFSRNDYLAPLPMPTGRKPSDVLNIIWRKNDVFLDIIGVGGLHHGYPDFLLVQGLFRAVPLPVRFNRQRREVCVPRDDGEYWIVPWETVTAAATQQSSVSQAGKATMGLLIIGFENPDPLAKDDNKHFSLGFNCGGGTTAMALWECMRSYMEIGPTVGQTLPGTVMPQLPSLPIPGHGDLPDYDVCLPVNLRPDADRLIRYLHELPHRRVKYCPWCGNTNVNLKNHSARQRLPSYHCGSCRKSCNSLSDSPFANMHRMDLWSTFAVYLLAGWSSVQIASSLVVTPKVYFNWGQAVGEVMAEECPQLHQWWTTRHYRENLQAPEHIAAQQQAVITWIETTLNAQHAICPRCGGTRTYRIKGVRPKFKCDPCVTCFSILSGTPLVGMIRPELWIDFVKGVMDGQSIQDLKRHSGLGMGGSTRWRQQFLLLIEALGHSELLQWITWMRSRRNNEAVSFVRQGGYLDKATRSIYPQGTRKGRFVARICS